MDPLLWILKYEGVGAKTAILSLTTNGLYYKLITIVIDAASVMLQIVASLMIVIDNAS